jgi:hypothetical protein
LIETFSPEALVAVEPFIGPFHRLGAQAAGYRASGLVAAHEPGIRQHVEMLHHRRQRHRERLGEFANRYRVGFAQARQQSAPCGIGKGRESAVEIGFVIVNHLVKYRRIGVPVKAGASFMFR